METVYQYDLVKICHDQDKKLLYISWRNYLTSEDFVRGFRALLQLTMELKIEKWLIDARFSDELKTENLHWSQEYTALTLEKSKLKKIARIVSKNTEHELEILNLVDYFTKNFSLPCEIRFYNTEQEAWSWLLEKESDKVPQAQN